MADHRRGVRDRDVVVVAALVILGVVLVARLTGFVPPLEDAVGLAPVVIAFLVLVTLFVLLRVARRR